ncbi:EF-P lysine aminoacylase EpmA [Thiomicrorhabdus lithotrophica]|uniref:EF-P lysine aminoacylase EpmA n=1 Tax=Thiomicrorhabdus lithotrophica TaxID=2949997 RepID=A0ABY8C7Z5_9GAMM|nr:EF-P lysine aminoacylase EpmA [Thiomicrorhabdus lithotrophica]WEJ62093.1 EF-P lysine aminoacylase EpmA [Thiomicrorhabdus lithotrophica]
MLNRRNILQKRSNLLKQVRAFFYAHSVIEVDTPILSQSATPDVHLQSLSTKVQVPGLKEPQNYYLHTSPEYPMKRLLCEGSGDIFYLGKVFRDGDLSPRHQIEFSMLEWYRIGFSMQGLIDEVIELIQDIIEEPLRVEKLSYQQVFQKYAHIDDVFNATSQDYQACLSKNQIPEIVGVDSHDKDLWEQLVLTEVIEPQLGKNAITVMYHYPAKDAALAQICQDNPLIAERFEIFVNGMELANGYHELADADVYRSRFEESLLNRKQLDLPQLPLDKKLLNTLAEEPLPDCCGVALGFDRLFLLQQEFENIQQGITFGIDQA